MHLVRRRAVHVACSLIATLFAGHPAALSAQRTGGPASAPPALVVFITIDQLRPDYLTRWHDQLTGGLRRLVDDGAFAPQGVHDHAITETAPGHASTLSGRFPYSTGIARNSVGVNTAAAPLVGSAGAGASPFRFNGTTLADWMIAADARTKVLSVSRKDRGAILPIGRAKLPVFWYAQAAGAFVTSTWYADTLPRWVQAFNAEDRVMTHYAGSLWTPLLAEANYPEADSVPGEVPSGEVRFPHVVPDDTLQARNLVISFPVMDELTLEFAWRGVRAMDLGAGPQTDLLAVSLSTTDAIGHRWGPDSRELHDQVLRLDRSLGVFLDSLVALRGADRVIIVLTSDHGVAPSPDVRSTWGDNARATRVFREDFDPALASLSQTVRRHRLASEAFGFDGLTLEVDRSKVVGQEHGVRELARAFAREARKVAGVERVDVIDDLVTADTVKDATARRWLHMFRPGGDVIAAITLRPYNYFGRGNTATHGSPHDYDATVPIIFWGTPFVPGRVRGSVRVVDIAPTLAQLLGISPSERLDGHALPQVFRPSAP